MSRAVKRILLIIGGAIGLLVLVALAALLFFDVNRYKPRLEAAASHAVGMDVRVGRLGMGFLPGFHITVEDGRILDEQGMAFAAAKRLSLWIDLLPLLRKEFRLRRIELTHPKLSIERDPHGRFNAGKLGSALLGALDGTSVSLSDGTLLYADRRSGEGFEATDVDLALGRMQLARARGPQLLKNLSVKGELTCGQIRTTHLSLSALKISADVKGGVFELEVGSSRVDLQACKLEYSIVSPK